MCVCVCACVRLFTKCPKGDERFVVHLYEHNKITSLPLGQLHSFFLLRLRFVLIALLHFSSLVHTSNNACSKILQLK